MDTQQKDPHEAQGFAPNQIPYILTPAERDQAKIYSLDLERQRRLKNARDAERAALARVGGGL